MRRIGVLIGRSRGRPGSAGPHRGVPAGAAGTWAGPTAATCGSTIAGAAGDADAHSQITRRNWSRSRRTSSSPPAARPWRPLLQATRTVPIVFAVVADPVGAGFVASLARPGGNATGFMQFEYSLSWEMAGTAQADRARRDASGGPSGSRHRQPGSASSPVIQSVAPSLGVEVSPVDVRDAGEIERAVAAFARSPNGGLIVTSSALAIASSRSDHRAGGPAQAARGLSRPLLRRRRRPDLLRA